MCRCRFACILLIVFAASAWSDVQEVKDTNEEIFVAEAEPVIQFADAAKKQGVVKKLAPASPSPRTTKSVKQKGFLEVAPKNAAAPSNAADRLGEVQRNTHQTKPLAKKTEKQAKSRLTSSEQAQVLKVAKKKGEKKEGRKQEGAKKVVAKNEGAKKGGAKDGKRYGAFAKKEGAKKEGAKKEGAKKEGAKNGKRYGAFVEMAQQYCEALVTKAESQTEMSDLPICKLIRDEVIKEAVAAATKLINQMPVQFTSVTKSKIEFTAYLTVHTMNAPLSGTLKYKHHKLAFSATFGSQVGGSKSYKLAHWLKMSYFMMSAEVDLATKKLTGASADASVQVTPAWETKKGITAKLALGWGQKTCVTMYGTVRLPAFEPIKHAVKIKESVLDISYAKGELSGNIQTGASIGIIKGGSTLTFDVNITFSKKKHHRSSIKFSGNMPDMIHHAIPGVDFVSFGFLQLSMSWKNGKFRDASISGKICLGKPSSCSAGKPNSVNEIGDLHATYESSRGWFIAGAMSGFSINKILNILGDGATAKQIPSVVGKASVGPYQSNCPATPESLVQLASRVGLKKGKKTSNKKAKGKKEGKQGNECFLLVAFTTHATSENARYPALEPGFTLHGGLTLFNQAATMSLRVPHKDESSQQAEVLVPGTNKKAKWAIRFDKPAESSESLAQLNKGKSKGKKGISKGKKGKGKKMFAFGVVEKTDKLKYDISFLESMQFGVNALAYEFPSVGKFLHEALHDIERPLAAVEKFLKKHHVKLSVAPSRKHFGISGTNGKLGLTVYLQKHKHVIAVGLGMKTAYLGQYLNYLVPGSNPFHPKNTKKHATYFNVFQNMVASLSIASNRVRIPDSLALGKPFSQRSIAPGVAIHGIIRKPTDCGKDIICRFCQKYFFVEKDTTLRLTATINWKLRFTFGIAVTNIPLNHAKSIMMLSGGLQFQLTIGSSFSISFAAKVKLGTTIHGSKVIFGGTMGVKLGTGFAIFFKVTMVGFLPRAFGNPKLSFWDLIGGLSFGTEGLMGLQLGGSMCVGAKADCKKLYKKGKQTKTGLMQMSKEDAAEEKSWIMVSEETKSALRQYNLDARRNQMRRTQIMTQQTSGGGVVADSTFLLSLYVGFSVMSKSFYFYAKISSFTFGEFFSALLGKHIASELPASLRKVKIGGYHPNNKKSFAYIAVATQEERLPGLTLERGFAASLGIAFLGTSMGVKLQITTNPPKFKMKLRGPAIDIMDGQVRLSRSKHQKKLGPKLDIDVAKNKFSGNFQAYIKLGWLFSAGIHVKVSKKVFSITARHVNILIFDISIAKFDMQLEPKPHIKEVKVVVNVKQIFKLIEHIARNFLQGIEGFLTKIENGFKTIHKYSKEAEHWFKKTDARLKHDTQYCPKYGITTAQQKQCIPDALTSHSCVDANNIPNGNRPGCGWFLGKYIEIGAFWTCREAYLLDNDVQSAFCKGFLDVLIDADEALSGGCKDLMKASDYMEKQLHKARNTVGSWQKKLSEFKLDSLGFTAHLNKHVSAKFWAKIKLGGEPMKTTLFDASLREFKSMAHFAERVADHAFNEVKDYIMKELKHIWEAIEGSGHLQKTKKIRRKLKAKYTKGINARRPSTGLPDNARCYDDHYCASGKCVYLYKKLDGQPFKRCSPAGGFLKGWTCGTTQQATATCANDLHCTLAHPASEYNDGRVTSQDTYSHADGGCTTDNMYYNARICWPKHTVPNNCGCYENDDCESKTCKGQTCVKKDCFPAAATVRTPTGVKSMAELKVGDCVQSRMPDGTVKACDTVYMFGHAESASHAEFVQLGLSSGRSISLSHTHFIQSAKTHRTHFRDSELKYATHVAVGDWLWDTDGLQQVVNKTTATLRGLYNPYTTSGNIIVDGVVASAHSEWFLDGHMPGAMVQYLPSVYQAALWPSRALFSLVGPVAAEWFGVSNPAVSASFWIDNFASMGLAAMFVLTLTMVLPMFSRRCQSLT